MVFQLRRLPYLTFFQLVLLFFSAVAIVSAIPWDTTSRSSLFLLKLLSF
jgi:hypothetical protein